MTDRIPDERHHRRNERDEWQSTLLLSAFAAALFLVTWIAPVPRGWVGLAAYLPLHTAMETFAVVVAMLVFSVGWASQRAERSQNTALLCYAFFGVGLLDFAHLMSYQGMPGLATSGSPSKAIDYWLMARSLAALALLAAVAWPPRPVRSKWMRFGLPAAELAVALVVVAMVEYREHWLPATFVPGRGLTAFKVNAEYAIIVMQLATAATVVLRRGRLILDPRQLFAILVVLSLSELCFTLYVEVSDLFNILGHVYKVAGYYLLYRLIFVDAVQRPFDDLRRSEEALRESERRYAELVDQAPDAMIVVDIAGRIEAVNPAQERLTGVTAAELIGRRIEDGNVLVPESVGRIREEFSRVVSGEERPPVELDLRHRDGQIVNVEAKARAMRREGAIAGVQVLLRDVSERKRAERQLNYLAYHDLLTGLPNRALLAERVQDAIEEARRHGRLVSVLFIDLDRFKYINDSLGHSVGDALLQAVADRLRTTLRPGDTVARHGGDEFVVILADVAHADDVARVAERMLAQFTQPFIVGDRELYITPSIGITLYPLDDDDPENLFKNADAAMYHAKESGRNNFRFFTSEMNVRARRRLAVETDLRRAVSNGELHLHFQPIVRVSDGRVVGMEALLRWHHPSWGVVAPAEFIPVAEESGLINAIGGWVVQEGCRQLGRWRAEGHADLMLAINVSSRQFQAQGLAVLIQRALDDARLAPELLELELTESALMQETEEVSATLRELDRIGVKIALDDFGTGYSSLAYLRRFPISRVKIDRSFVKDLTVDPDDATIAQTIIAMAHSLGMQVIAEGVESAEQLEFLKRYGCDAVQGYLLGRPQLPADCDLSVRETLSSSTTRESTS